MKTIMKTDIAFIMGRWQFLHKGHGLLLQTALSIAPKVIVGIGSAHRARDAHNPFTWEERKQMFEAVLTPAERERVVFMPIRDYFDDQRWQEAVRAGVAKFAKPSDSIALIGYKKDNTSYYLDLFPTWKYVGVEPQTDISATDLRKAYFETTSMQSALTVIGNWVASGVLGYLEAWAHLPAYRRIAEEHKAVMQYRQKWTAPFYLTADALVTSNAHLLLIKRGGPIGKGLYALPGGFVEPREQFYPAALRELEEETGLRMLPSRMAQALQGPPTIFDHPARSPRGRIITAAFHFDLKDDHLPAVKAQSDADAAMWVPKESLPSLEDQLFEDHACIIDRYLGLYPSA